MNKSQILELANEYLSANYSHFTQEQKDLAIALCLLAFGIDKGVYGDAKLFTAGIIGDAKLFTKELAVIKAVLIITLHISNELGVEFPKMMVTVASKKRELEFTQSLIAYGFPTKLAESLVTSVNN